MAHHDEDDAALIALARQLADAYGEARTTEDQDFACDEIGDFLADHREHAPGEALLALLDLPFTVATFPLVDRVTMTLAERGWEVVELLLRATLGEVYDPDGPAAERAAEVLDAMDPVALSFSLGDLLAGGGSDALKGAAVDRLVALGARAEPALAGVVDDPAARPWALAALAQLRFACEHQGSPPGDDDAPPALPPWDDDGTGGRRREDAPP